MVAQTAAAFVAAQTVCARFRKDTRVQVFVHRFRLFYVHTETPDRNAQYTDLRLRGGPGGHDGRPFARKMGGSGRISKKTRKHFFAHCT